jgi:hypothetical protein
MGRPTGTEAIRHRYGKTYSLFDLSLNEEDAKDEIKELLKAGYFAYRTAAKDGAYHIWVSPRNKEVV